MNGATTANKVLAALLALALLLGGLLAAVEIVLAQLNRPHWLVPAQQWSAWLGQARWDAAVVRVVLVGLVAVGLLLLVAALRRGKPRELAVPARTDAVQVSMARRAVEKTVAAAAQQTSGVQSATATASRRSITVTAGTLMRAPGDLAGQILAAVTHRLDELGLDALRPKVKLTRKQASR